MKRRAISSNQRLDGTVVEIELLVLGPSLGHNKSRVHRPILPLLTVVVI